MQTLHVLYDETCPFCVACAEWLHQQPQWVELVTWPAGAAATRARFPSHARGDAKLELTVVDDTGGVYHDTDAWLMTLWALKDYRAWSLRLASSTLRPLARQVFELVSKRRKSLSARLLRRSELEVSAVLARHTVPADRPACSPEKGACQVRMADPRPTQCGACGGKIPHGREFCPHCLSQVVANVRDG